MQSIILFHNSKWFSPIWALLFALSLILLWYQRKKWVKGYDTFFWMIVLSLLIIYCPLFAKILIPRFLPSYAEYERLAWVFFEIPLMSYIVVMLAKSFMIRKHKFLFIVAFLTLLLIVGSPDNRDFFQKPQNRYKISQDAVSVCDKLNALSPKGNMILCIQLDSVDHYRSGIDLDGTLYYGIRTYESRFSLDYKVVSPQEYKDDNFILADELPEVIDYYVCPKVEKVYKELERLGYKYVDESENFAIFQNQNKHGDGSGS